MIMPYYQSKLHRWTGSYFDKNGDPVSELVNRKKREVCMCIENSLFRAL